MQKSLRILKFLFIYGTIIVERKSTLLTEEENLHFILQTFCFGNDAEKGRKQKTIYCFLYAVNRNFFVGEP